MKEDNKLKQIEDYTDKAIKRINNNKTDYEQLVYYIRVINGFAKSIEKED